MSLIKTSFFYIILIILFLISCIAPPDSIEKNPIRDGFPVNEIYVINNLSETISLINSDRVALAHQPYLVNDILLTDSVPNKLVFRNDLGYIVNSFANTVTIFDSRTMSYSAVVSLQSGNNPWDISFIQKSSNLYGLVSNFLTDSVSVIDFGHDGKSGSIIQTILLNPYPGDEQHRPRPEGISVVNEKAYVACTGWNFSKNDFDAGSVAVIDLSPADPENWMVLSYISTRTNPQTVIPYPDQNEIHVLCSGINGNDDGRLEVINIASDTIITNLPVGGSPYRYAISTNETITYLGGVGAVLAYNYQTKIIINDSLTPYFQGSNSDQYFSGLAFDPVHSLLYIADFSKDTVTVMDVNTKTILQEISVGDGPLDVVFKRIE